MATEFVRVLRTPHSERFLLRAQGNDFAALDIHYLENRSVNSTLILYEDCGVTEGQIPELLREIDDVLLPDVSLMERNLVFTVVVGRVHGAFAAEPDETPPSQ